MLVFVMGVEVDFLIMFKGILLLGLLLRWCYEEGFIFGRRVIGNLEVVDSVVLFKDGGGGILVVEVGVVG